MGWNVKKRTKVIEQNTTITDTDFGGWMAVNIGTEDVEIDKVVLQPREGVSFLDIPADAHWGTPIQINVPAPGAPVGGKVILSQLIYKEDEDRSIPTLLRDILKRVKGE